MTRNQPDQVLNVVEDMISDLDDEQLSKLLHFVREWNTTAKFSAVAQSVLNVVLNKVGLERVLGLKGIKELLEAFVVYTERHYERAKSLAVDIEILDLLF